MPSGLSTRTPACGRIGYQAVCTATGVCEWVNLAADTVNSDLKNTYGSVRVPINGHEVDSAIGFARLNDPGFVRDAATFKDAVAAIDYTFNWFYADKDNIALFSGGRLPVRHPQVDLGLPTWGTGKYEWQGFRKDLPRELNPSRGWIATANHDIHPPGYDPPLFFKNTPQDARYRRLAVAPQWNILSGNQWVRNSRVLA